MKKILLSLGFILTNLVSNVVSAETINCQFKAVENAGVIENINPMNIDFKYNNGQADFYKAVKPQVLIAQRATVIDDDFHAITYTLFNNKDSFTIWIRTDGLAVLTSDEHNEKLAGVCNIGLF